MANIFGSRNNGMKNMTDDEKILDAISEAFYSKDVWGERCAAAVSRARELLAKPVATREEVEKYVQNTHARWLLAADTLDALVDMISHFSAPANQKPIITEKEVQEWWGRHNAPFPKDDNGLVSVILVAIEAFEIHATEAELEKAERNGWVNAVAAFKPQAIAHGVPWCSCNNAPAEVGACCDHRNSAPPRDVPSVEEVEMAMGKEIQDTQHDLAPGSIRSLCARVAHAMMQKMAPRQRMLIEGMDEGDFWQEWHKLAPPDGWPEMSVNDHKMLKIAFNMAIRLATTPAPVEDPDREAKTETCTGCHYWNQTGAGDEFNKPRGQCRLRPPHVTAPNEGFREWPITEDHDWCGEWRAAARRRG